MSSKKIHSHPQTFIFIGRSASGKGTQAAQLISHLKKEQGIKTGDIVHIETGEGFRDFLLNDSYTSSLAKEITKNGERQQDFLAVWMWSHVLIRNLRADHYIVFDGTPRSATEAHVLDTALKFYKREKPHIIYLNVSEAWSLERMSNRGRIDDKTDIQKKRRQEWFKTNVLDAVGFFTHNPDYSFSEINGEQLIEKVHQDILKEITLN
jgi:adenylate kinase family enzyme